VRRQDGSKIFFPLNLLKELKDQLSRLIVECACRLVRKDEQRGIHQRSGDGDTLLFPTGQFARTVLQPIPQTH
jgi:hypothetical protein